MTDTYTDNAELPADDGPLPFSGTEEGLRDAAEELGRRREAASRERPELPEEEPDSDSEVVKIQYVDGKDRSAGISAAQASKDFEALRQEQANLVLQDLQLQWDADQAEQGQPKALNENQAEQQQQPQSDEEAWANYVAQLPPEGKAHVAAAQQYEARTQQVDQVADAYTMALTNLLGGLDAQVGQQFPDIKNTEDVRKLAQTDPARFEVLRHQMAQAAALYQEAGRVNQARQQQQAQVYQHQFADFARQQDQVVGQLVPELAENADKATRRNLQEASVELLREKGFSQNELSEAWHGRPILLRDARAQAVIADAAKWRLSQERNRVARQDLNGRKKQPSPVQRPGLASNVMADHSADAAMERFQKSHSINDAVRVMQARRARR